MLWQRLALGRDDGRRKFRRISRRRWRCLYHYLICLLLPRAVAARPTRATLCGRRRRRRNLLLLLLLLLLLRLRLRLRHGRPRIAVSQQLHSRLLRLHKTYHLLNKLLILRLQLQRRQIRGRRLGFRFWSSSSRSPKARDV